MIDTVPLPEKGTVKIPEKLAQEFMRDLRVVVRHPWVVGIPVPDRLVKPELLKLIGRDMEIFIVPKRFK